MPRLPDDDADRGGERDERDASRPTSPMVRADDAVEVDSTGLEPEQVVERIVALAAGALA